MLAKWVPLVNERIALYWPMENRGSFGPLATRIGGSFLRRASDLAWVIVKAAKASGQTVHPTYIAKEISFDETACRVTFNHETSFDGWIEVQTLVKRHRVALPFKSFRRLNEALERGTVRKCIKLVRSKRGWFACICIAIEAKPYRLKGELIGIDVGKTVAAATSTGRFYGRDLDELRRRTRHRAYRSTAKMPYRQGLNRVAKQIVADHPAADFAVEQLDFRGSNKRGRVFRSRLQTFAYQHLARRLEDLGQTEGFRVLWVDPAYSSQTCPKCREVNKGNRQGDNFRCLACDFTGHSDVVAAINLATRKERRPVGRRSRTSALPNRVSRVSRDIQCPDQKGALR